MVDALERIHPRNLKVLADELTHLVESRLWAQVILGMVLGIGVGIALGPSVGWVSRPTAALVSGWLALPGNLFLAAIEMVVMPLVMASVIRGIASSGDGEQLRKTGLGLAVYFLLTTLAAIAVGLMTGYLVRPGEAVDIDLRRSLMAKQPLADNAGNPGHGLGFGDIPEAITSLLPVNPFGAIVEGQMLQVVIFSAVLGVALISLAPESSKPLLDLMGSIQQVSMRIVSFVMRIAPLAVFGLLASTMAETGAGILSGLVMYAVAVIGALVLLLMMYLAIVVALGRRNPMTFLGHIREAQLLAFSTGSSAATMPLSIRIAEEGLNVRPSTAQLVIPLGTTVNMGGTACYQGIATIFMAQLFGMNLHPGAILALMLTALGTSIGAPATPGVGTLILAGVLNSAGIPLTGLALIIGLDQILDRFRTVLNVSGDLVACVVMDRYVGGKVSREQEIAREQEFDVQRQTTGHDVVTT